MSTITADGRMPKVTLYVKETDEPVWEAARRLAGDAESLSGIVSKALSAYVRRKQSIREGTEKTGREMREYGFELWGQLNDNIRRKVELMAAVLDSKSPASGDPFNAYRYDLYVTKTGKLVIHQQAFAPVWSDGQYRIDPEQPTGATVQIFRSFDEFCRDETAIRQFGDAFPSIANVVGEDFTWKIE